MKARLVVHATRLGAAVLLTAALLVPTPAAVAGNTATTCEEVTFPVSVAGLPQTMAGTLCVPAGADTVQVLIPGGFYNRAYWDIAVNPGARSYRQAMNRAGYATLAVDRLGTGSSSKPPSAVVTAITQAGAVHQVVTAVRSRFDRVVLAGHSLGSAISVIEAGAYHDVDGVLVTAMSHHPNVPGIAPIATTFVPAALDPAFADRSLDPGYLTTAAGTRYFSMHSPGPYNERVVAYDEATKDVAAPAELVDGILLGVVTPYTALIDVPVLTAAGSMDPTLCGPLATDCSSSAAYRHSEAPYYGPAAQLQAYVLAGYGHSFNYAPNAPEFHAAVIAWADRVIGP